MKKQFLYIALLVIALGGLSSQNVRGQGKAQAAIMRTTAVPGDDGVAVSVLFTVLDGNGQALQKEAVQFGDGAQAYGPSIAGVAANVEPASTPIRIALVIDASGSMAKEIGDVRQAAIKFVGAAPENAEIAVFKFSDEVEQIQEFTKKAQIGLVENAILSITNRAPNTGNTCIYKAAYAAIKAANSGFDQNSAARPAVVLFTDGRDSEAGPTCGEIKEDQVVTQAIQSSVVPTQVHTIGLCVADGCSNVNADALRTMAEKTHASTKVGTLAELDDLFKSILSALNNQWMATATVKPDIAGKHQLTFNLPASINNAPIPIPLTTEFESTGFGKRPDIVIEGLHPNKNNTEYSLNLKVTNPDQVKQITITLRSSSNLTEWSEQVTNISETVTRTIPAAALAELKEGSEFVIDIDAVDVNGAEIKDAEGKKPSIKATYSPDAKQPISFEFGLPAYNAQQGSFVVKLSQVQSDPDTKLLYKGSITEDARPVMEIPEGVYNGSDITVALPPSEVKELGTAKQPKKYTIRLTLFEVGGQTATQETAIEVQPPRPLSLMERFSLALNNPVVWGSIGAIFAIVAGAIVVMSLRNRKQPIPAPYNPQTQMGERKAPKVVPPAPTPAKESFRPQPAANKTEIGEIAAEPALRIRIVSTPDPSSNRGAVINQFPCVIGRENSSFLIAGDPKVSRQHAEITVQGKQIIIKDLRSGNGTAFVVRDPKRPSGAFIEKKRLEKGGSAEWDYQSIIRLGPSTLLELKPEGSLQPSSSATIMHDNYDNRTEIFG